MKPIPEEIVMLKILKEKLSRQTGQNLLEYSIIVALVAAAFTAMSFYIGRAVQGQLNDMDGLTVPKKTTSTPVFTVPI